MQLQTWRTIGGTRTDQAGLGMQGRGDEKSQQERLQRRERVAEGEELFSKETNKQYHNGIISK